MNISNGVKQESEPLCNLDAVGDGLVVRRLDVDPVEVGHVPCIHGPYSGLDDLGWR